MQDLTYKRQQRPYYLPLLKFMVLGSENLNATEAVEHA